jgi:predicted amidohydrolase YtcJ
MAAYNGRGVTTGFDGHNMSPAHVAAYQDLRAAGRMTMRMLCAVEGEGFAYPPWQPLTLDQYRANLALGGSLVDLDDDLLRVSGVTWGQAGPCWPGGSRMYEPYQGPFGRPTRGMTFLSDDKLAAFVEFCLGEQVQANFVTSGYRDHDDVLAELARHGGPTSVRATAEATNWLIQHAILITEAQARAYHDHGFSLTTCMGFSAAKGDLYGQRIGPWVWADQVPLNRLLRVGLTVGCGSDWGPKNPWENMVLAQTHEFWGSGHRNDGPDHAVTRAQAVAMWTREAAKVLAWDGIGTLVPGSWADVIAVDRDPLTCDLDTLADTRVHRTWLAGRLVHPAD